MKGKLRDKIFVFVSKRESAHKQELCWLTCELLEVKDCVHSPLYFHNNDHFSTYIWVLKKIFIGWVNALAAMIFNDFSYPNHEYVKKIYNSN